MSGETKEDDVITSVETSKAEKARMCFSSSMPYLGLGVFQMGYAFNLCLSATIWPKQIEMIVQPGTKELWNGIIGIPSTIMNTIVPPLAGSLSDRIHLNFGKRHPLMLSGFLWAAFWTILSALFVFPWRVGNWNVAFTLFAVVSTFQWIGLSNGIGSFTGLVPDTVPHKRLGLAGGVLGVGRSLGNLLSVLIAGVIVQFFPYPFNFVCAYGFAACVFIYTSLFAFCAVPEAPPGEVGPPFSWKEFIQSFFLWPPTEYWNFYCVFVSRFVIWFHSF
jgi:MFS family permease